MRSTLNATLLLCVMSTLGACSDNDSTTTDQAQSETAQLDGPVVATGAITHYGSVSIADEAGQVSDLVASFYRLERGVSADFLASQLSGSAAMCEVQDDDAIDFEEISLVFIPDVQGVDKTAVSAGESVVLTSSAGTFATLDRQIAADFIFYDVETMFMLGEQVVPQDMLVDIPGSTDIPSILSAPVPVLEPLGSVDINGSASVSASSRFSWTPASQPGTLLRIFTSTAGGFFLEDGVTVTCLVPDTGSFSFPADVQRQLGSDFVGSTPIVSRLAISTVQVESTVLYVMRESFGELN